VCTLGRPVAKTPPSDGPSLCPRNLRAVTDESRKERVDRELIELLNELRVALPGVQVLFAFLLGIPFANRFREVDGSTEAMYLVALIATAAASAFLIAPSGIHRLRFRDPDKEAILFQANRLAIAGLSLLALSMGSSVYVVASFLHGPWAGAALGGVITALIAVLWFLLPLRERA
jgi:hypothetical protein